MKLSSRRHVRSGSGSLNTCSANGEVGNVSHSHLWRDDRQRKSRAPQTVIMLRHYKEAPDFEFALSIVSASACHRRIETRREPPRPLSMVRNSPQWLYSAYAKNGIGGERVSIAYSGRGCLADLLAFHCGSANTVEHHSGSGWSISHSTSHSS